METNFHWNVDRAFNTINTPLFTVTPLDNGNMSWTFHDSFGQKIKETVEKKPEVSPETRTKLDIRDGKIYVKHYKNGYYEAETFAMSDIKDVTHYGKAVLVTFADGTKTKAVLDDVDEFTLEQGISICITKKLLGKDGDSAYNKIINRAFKVKQQNEDAAKKSIADRLEKKRRKEAAAARKAQKKAKKREEQIEIQKEAYIRAMRELNDDMPKKNKKKIFPKAIDK